MIDATAFYGIFHAIWQQLRDVHAPVYDTEWNEWHDKIVDDMSSPDTTWSTILPDVFNRFFVKLDEVEEQVAKAREILNAHKS